MSQLRVLAVNRDNVTRVRLDNGSQSASGGNKRLYVGDDDGRRYKSYLRFALNWTDVGRIVRATLVVYTDDGLGRFPTPNATDTPQIAVRRLTSAFDEGNNADEDFDASDWTDPSDTTSGGRGSVSMAKASGAVNRIDITGIVNAWAPKTVQQSTGAAGLGATNHGIVLRGYKGVANQWAGWSNHHTVPGERPTIELEYDYGLTAPNVPANMTPTGNVASLAAFEGDFSDVRTQDKLAYAEVEVWPSATPEPPDSSTTRIVALKAAASNSQIISSRFSIVPGETVGVAPAGQVFQFRPKAGTTYKWRARVWDNQGQVSAWSSLVSFTVTNNAPNAPTTTPANASSFASLNGVLFRGTFSDPDVGDTLGSYQVQMADLPEGDPLWEEANSRVWDTGRVLTPFGATSFETPYGGQSLDAGSWRWRARVWDNRGAVSAWTYKTLTLTADFDVEPGSQDTVQLDPRAPWRIVIKAMGVDRGPGSIVAILENAKSVGASLMYNSPGELHFTLPVDHPQISVIEPKQTHYSVQFYSGDGWREVFAGLMWDFDANERDVIFYGIDYLALFDLNSDERWDAANPDKPASSGGSKYVDKTIAHIVADQINLNRNLTDSPTKFITVGSIATMDEKVTIWSTMQPTLRFVTSLIDSHKQGTGKKTRIRIERTPAGAYQLSIVDDPGATRDELRLEYGGMVQGYRVIPFGKDWASRVNAIGRSREGLRVLYKSASAPGIDTSVWGRITTTRVVDDIADENDLLRRLKQLAINSSKLGRQIGLGIRSGFLQPRDGYDICDSVPVAIRHGAVNTDAYGSGYWTIYGVAWEAGDQAEQTVILTLLPREDSTPPDTDLIPTFPISTQREWQIDWVPPEAIDATSKYWFDVATGITYLRNEDGSYTRITHDPRANNLLVNSGFEITPVSQQLSNIWTVAADWGTALSQVNLATGGASLGMTTSTY